MNNAQKLRHQRELERVPDDLVFEQTGGECDYCSSVVNPRKGWVKLGGGAWLDGRLLWSEVRLAHLVCEQHERHFRKWKEKVQDGPYRGRPLLWKNPLSP